jgi:hypothetical protein
MLPKADQICHNKFWIFLYLKMLLCTHYELFMAKIEKKNTLMGDVPPLNWKKSDMGCNRRGGGSAASVTNVTEAMLLFLVKVSLRSP